MVAHNGQGNLAKKDEKDSAKITASTVWSQLVSAAQAADLDPAKFSDDHREIVERIVTFLNETPASVQPEKPSFLGALLGKKDEGVIRPKPIPPIIICGVPGTGKTTFLYILDGVLRSNFALPDTVSAQMAKPSGRTHTVHKRHFNKQPVSLLSVRSWGELLHFFAWNRAKHRFNPRDEAQFIDSVLAPMRIIFADEVEMTGYAPTLPTLAKHGILVVGTSNQNEFRQLENEQLPPIIYHFGGADMRSGDPTDAVVTEGDAAWALFDQLQTQEAHYHELLAYRSTVQDGTVYIYFEFKNAVNAALLDTGWHSFLQTIYHAAVSELDAAQANPPFTLLFDDFSLEILRTDYNAIIRFVALFDAIEQMETGVLVRNKKSPPELSREAINHMKATIYSSRGVSEEVKVKTVAGIDRCTSRIGQAGHRANAS